MISLQVHLILKAASEAPHCTHKASLLHISQWVASNPELSRVTLKFGPVAWHQGTPEIRQIGFRRPRYVEVALLAHAPGRPISMARQPAGQQGPGWGYGLLSPRISNQVISALPHVAGRAVALLLKSNQRRNSPALLKSEVSDFATCFCLRHA